MNRPSPIADTREDQRGAVDIRRNLPGGLGRVDDVDEKLVDLAIHGRADSRDGRVARRLRPDLHELDAAGAVLLDEMLATQRDERAHDVGGVGDMLEVGAETLAVALAQPGHERVLRVEVTV